MINEEIATIFENMSRVLSFKGGDRFRIMAYQRAALSLRDLKEKQPQRKAGLMTSQVSEPIWRRCFSVQQGDGLPRFLLSVAQLEYVRYGVFVARRAWVQPQSVVNYVAMGQTSTLVATYARHKHQSLCVIPSFYDPKAC